MIKYNWPLFLTKLEKWICWSFGQIRVFLFRRFEIGILLSIWCVNNPLILKEWMFKLINIYLYKYNSLWITFKLIVSGKGNSFPRSNCNSASLQLSLCISNRSMINLKIQIQNSNAILTRVWHYIYTYLRSTRTRLNCFATWCILCTSRSLSWNQHY